MTPTSCAALPGPLAGVWRVWWHLARGLHRQHQPAPKLCRRLSVDERRQRPHLTAILVAVFEVQRRAFAARQRADTDGAVVLAVGRSEGETAAVVLPRRVVRAHRGASGVDGALCSCATMSCRIRFASAATI